MDNKSALLSEQVDPFLWLQFSMKLSHDDLVIGSPMSAGKDLLSFWNMTCISLNNHGYTSKINLVQKGLEYQSTKFVSEKVRLGCFEKIIPTVGVYISCTG